MKLRFKLPKPYGTKRVVFHCCYLDRDCRRLHKKYDIPMRLIIMNRNFVLNQGFTRDLYNSTTELPMEDDYHDEME